MSLPFLPALSKKAHLDKTLERLLHYYKNTQQHRVTPVLDKAAIRETVRVFYFEQKLDPEYSIDYIINGLRYFSVHTPHPKYFGLFNLRSQFPSIVADLITAVFNPQLAA